MAFANLALLQVLLQPLMTTGHFVASLHSNFVVHLDFESEKTNALPVPAAEDLQMMSFAGGQSRFRCRLPSRTGTQAGSRKSPDAPKPQEHFISAKLAPYRGNCWKLQQDYWTYDVCFGRKIAQFRPETDLRYSLGERDPEADRLLPDGGVIEHYIGGTDNRTTAVHYVCGSSELQSRIFTIEEAQPLAYTLRVSGAGFCSWREKDGQETRDKQGNTLKISSLLEPLRSTCLNLTQGWWTYEYCFPRTLRQYHMQVLSDGVKRDPDHLLGQLLPQEPIQVNQVEMGTVKLKPSISPRERRAPPSNHMTLEQRLSGGSVCDETKRHREALLHFQCPTNWQSRPDHRMVSIREGALCEYEVVVQTVLLCGHQRLIPTMPRGRETLQCYVEP